MSFTRMESCTVERYSRFIVSIPNELSFEQRHFGGTLPGTPSTRVPGTVAGTVAYRQVITD